MILSAELVPEATFLSFMLKNLHLAGEILTAIPYSMWFISFE